MASFVRRDDLRRMEDIAEKMRECGIKDGKTTTA